MRYFLIFLILSWWIFGAWFWTCKVKNLCVKKEVVTQPVVEKKIENPLLIKAEGLNLRSNDNLRFNVGGINPEIPSAVDNRFSELNDYLKRNPNKELTLTGLYSNSDAKPANYANLGLGRAAKVKDALVKKGIKADQIVTKAQAKNGLIVDNNKVIGGVDFLINNKAVAAAPKPIPAAKPASQPVKPAAKPVVKETPLVIAGAGLNLRSDVNLKFPVGKSTPEIPPKVNQNFTQLSQFLKKNVDKQVTVTGLYGNKDPKPVNKKFANIGLERAENLKTTLTRKGIKADQIVTRAMLRNNLQVINNKVIGGATFAVGNKPKAAAPPAKPVVKKPDAKKPDGVQTKALDFSKATADNFKKGQRIELKNVQFDSGSANLKNTSFVDLNKLVTVLNTNKNIKIEIGGHTDSLGDLALNNSLSQKRAESVATYLTGKGITKNRLISKGYGPAKPVAPNNTKVGRQANRRVEVTVN